MNKKKILSFALACLMAGTFLTSGCGKTVSVEGVDSNDVLTLRIANCEEYIDQGDWDEDETIELENGESILASNSMVEDFEIWYEETYGQPVKVEYSTYGTNEDLYNSLTLGDVFDLACPSEYMIMKLMEEDQLTEFSDDFYDADIENNYYAQGVSPYIDQELKDLSINGESLHNYTAGYMWGTIGIIYNPTEVSEEDASHWSMLLDPKFYKRVTMKDSIRDSYIVSRAIAEEDLFCSEEFLNRSDYAKALAEHMNATDSQSVEESEKILSQMRKNAYSLETDSGKADMVSGKVLANMQWSGDAVYTMQQADEDGVTLCYSVPEEATNLWFDGWVMLKSGISEDPDKQQAAEAFLNFISRPDNVVRNMYYIGYTSVISGGEDETIWDYLKYNYQAEDLSTAVDYPLDYFFGGNDRGSSYVLQADPEQMNRELYAQYPTEDVIHRAAIMKCFDSDANKRINNMWMNIRCFSF